MNEETKQTAFISLAMMFAFIAAMLALSRGCQVQNEFMKECITQHSPLECERASRK